MSNQEWQSKYDLDLIDNSIDSFKFGIDAYIRGEKNIRYYKLAIKEIFSSYELILKDLLARNGESLIFRQTNDKSRDDDKTITFDDTLTLLRQRCGIDIKENSVFSKSLQDLKRLRNMVQHYKITIYKNQIDSIIARTIPFMEYILNTYYHINIRSIIDSEQFDSLLSIQNCRDELYRDGKSKYENLPKNIKYKGYNNHKALCNICGSKFLIYEDDFIRCLCCHNLIELIEFAEIYITDLLESDERLQRFECARCEGDYLVYNYIKKHFECLHCGNKENPIRLSSGEIIPPTEAYYRKLDEDID